MKKSIFIFAFLLNALSSICGKDISAISGEMKSAYKSGFYPGVVKFADEILQLDNNSVFSNEALFLKGESLFRMGMINDALSVLSKSEDIYKNNQKRLSEIYYWKARCYSVLDDSKNALDYYYKSLKNTSENQKYYEALYFCAQELQKVGEYKQAVLLYENILANGSKYSQSEYEKSLLNFFEVCYLNNEFIKIENYFDLISNENFSAETKFKSILYNADAKAQLGKYSSAYKDYCYVLSDGPDTLATLSMKKAYFISSEHYSEMKEEPGAVIKKAEKRLSNYPELVSEFWVRLAIDAFEIKDYKKSLDYFKNSEKDSSVNLQIISDLYKTEIEFLSSKSGVQESASNAYTKLLSSIKKYNIEPLNPYYDDYQISLIRYSGLMEDWDNTYKIATQFFEQKNKTNKSTLYWAALSLYKKNDFIGACNLLKDNNYKDDSEIQFLYAQCLAKLGKSSEADKIFYSLAQKQLLSNDGRLDYARTLLNAGHLISTIEQTSIATGTEAYYMKALALLNRRQWTEAEINFEKSLKEKKLDSTYLAYARFYLGYCQYQLGKFKEAYSNLYTYIKNYENHSLIWNGCIFAARASAQIEDLKAAASMAEKAINVAKNTEQKQESILLCAGIYNDDLQYKKALDILAPYKNEKNTFGYQCLYLTAQIYVQNQEYDNADKAYNLLSAEKNAGLLAEESMYRRGELFYTRGKFSESVNLFESYIKKYHKGHFYYGAMYFAADSLVQENNLAKAILYYQQIADTTDNTTYKYGSLKKLVELHKFLKEYKVALSYAKLLLNEYGQQAKDDGIDVYEKELVALSEGADSRVLKLETEYAKEGSEKTVKGRIIGTELAQLYYSNLDTRNEAEKLAKSLLDIQKKSDSESEFALKNSLLLAEYYRSKGENKASAEMYLDAAIYARKVGKSKSAERALYGAVEAFDSAGLKGDAKITAQSLLQMYPNSSYNDSAYRIVGEILNK